MPINIKRCFNDAGVPPLGTRLLITLQNTKAWSTAKPTLIPVVSNTYRICRTTRETESTSSTISYCFSCWTAKTKVTFRGRKAQIWAVQPPRLSRGTFKSRSFPTRTRAASLPWDKHLDADRHPSSYFK